MNAYTRGYSLTSIGLTVAIACALFAASFLYMTNRSLTHRRGTLYVRIVTAEGLKKGDQLLHRGVQVGEVRGIRFGAMSGVVVNVKLTEKVVLRSDATAVMVAADIFGRQTLVLHDGTGLGTLADKDTIEGAPPVSITARMEDLGRTAQRIIGDTTTLLLHHTLRNVADLSNEMAQLTRQSRVVLAREAEGVHRISVTTSTVLDNLAAATAPERLDPLISNIAAMTAGLDTTVTAVRQVAVRLSNSQGSAGKLLSDAALYDRVTGSLAALESLLTDVRANPKRYINVSVF
jgi:phospholipid/cholesterol/gamma-HCH transport system substrate-binding protein